MKSTKMAASVPVASVVILRAFRVSADWLQDPDATLTTSVCHKTALLTFVNSEKPALVALIQINAFPTIATSPEECVYNNTES